VIKDIEKKMISRSCNTLGDKRNAYRFLVGKHER
jgi:hypothetical protein